MSKIKAEYFEWWDHCSISGQGGGAWMKTATLDNVASRCKSIGFVVKEDKKNVTICSGYDATDGDGVDTVKDVSLIVKSCIIKRKRITF